MYTILCSGDTGVICPPRVRVLTWLVGAVALMVACAPVQRHFALPDLTISEPSFMPTLEALTGAAVTTGNEVDLLLNGDEIFPAQIAAIRAARDTITYAQYFYEDGPPAKQIAEALAERCRASIQVHILLDGFGTLAMPASYRELMERAGCQVATYRPVARLAWNRANNRNHRRVLVVDGLIGFTGGSGASNKWMGNGRVRDHWRETDVRLEGPAVSHLQGAFAENWLEATGEVLGGARYFPPTGARGSMRAQIVRSSPAGGSYAMYTMFTLAMASARRSILITNPYFVPDADMVRIIAAAPARGTRVVLLLPGAIDNNIVRQASRSQFARLLEAGVEIYEYRAGLLHAKTMIVDGIWATIGSTNLDNRSFALNEELNIAVYSREFAARLERIFADDLEHSRRIDLAEWNSRGLRQRMLEWLSFPLRDQL
jgi:cardiolipin synthase